MILEKETFEEFGYYPSKLSPKSGRKILAACDECGLVRIISKHRYRSLCISCCQKVERNGMFGIEGEESPAWRGGKIRQICKYCGKEFTVRLSKIKDGRGKFCSCECMGKWKAKHLRGENSVGWKGGISFEPYCYKFNFAFKEYIREKFGRICFLCGKTEPENSRRLDVHHVNYDKDCICNDNLTCQFVPLCRSCNSKVNHNREEWEKKINDMLHNKLNGWYI